MAKGAARSKSERPTPVSTWKKEAAGTLVKLPSGRKALLRKPHALHMIQRDMVPNPVLGLVLDAAGVSEVSEAKEKAADQAGREYADYILWICSRAFVEPRLWFPDPAKPEEQPPPDWLTADDVDDADLMHVFSWAEGIDISALQEALGDLGPFPDERPGAADGGDGEGVRSETEQPA